MLKRCLLAAGLCLCLALGLRVPAEAAETAASGTCGVEGANVTWVLDTEGTLTLSGTGKMADYVSTSGGGPPWDDRKSSVKKIVIGEGVTGVGSWAFMSCTALTELTIPQGVTSIGEAAFYGCEALEKVTIPGSVTSMGDNAFGGCEKLKTAGPAGGGYDIEFGWKEAIPAGAFMNCRSLTAVTIPQGVTSIGDRAFQNCGLTGVTIPAGVTAIGAGTFSGCFSLKEIAIPEGVTGIGDNAFYFCMFLTEAVIPASVTRIGEAAFDLCGLERISFGGGRRQWGALAAAQDIGVEESVSFTYGVESYTVSYVPDGGTGEKAPELFDRGDLLTLPGADAFAAPVGRSFKAWRVDGVERAPGETQTVSISVNVQDLASYDYTDANGNGYKGYELDEGDYVLMALPNAHGWATSAGVMHPFALTNGTTDAEHAEGRKAAYLELDDFSGNKIENLFSKENGIFYSLRDNTGANKFNADPTANQVLMSRSNGFVLPAAPTVADLTMSLNMYKSLLYWDNFSVDNLVPDTVIAGNSEATTPVYYKDGQTIDGVVSPADFPWMVETAANSEAMKNWNQTGEYKYADGTTVKLSDMTGIDPYSTEKVGGTGRFKDKTGVQAWEEFMNSLSWQDLMDLVGKLQKQALPAISMNSMADGEFAFSPAGMCNFTCTCILAATWNTELANLKGTIAADMMILSGRNTGWGTSANTHRSPFAGRVFEYTSEDGILGGYISSAETLGANSRGLATYTKHCALNDQETSRNGRNLFAWVSEQAMREIYYKSFQMVAQEGQSAGIMGAFARAGRVSINVNYNFVTKLFREEWGCKTISFTTDMYAGMKSCSPLDLLVRAGTDTIATSTMSGTWDAANKKVTVKNGDAVTGANQYYTTRKCAMIFLWTHANTAMNKNGVSFNWAEAELNATQGTAVAAGVKVNSGATGDKVEYVVSNGALPAGLTLNADGTISGTPTAKAGEYKFTVECRIDNWVKNTKQYTYTVASGFVIDENEASVGEEFFGEISSETVTTQKYNDGIVYSVKEGVLPAGLSLDANGVISGTPAEAGKFTVVINVAASRSERQGWTSIKVTDNYEYEVTLTVEGDEPVADHGGIVSSAINDKGELEITYADGTVDNLGVVVGKDGADGVNGTNGKDGVDGKDAEGGCSGSVAATVVPVTVALVLAGVAVIVFRKKTANK